MAVGGNPLREAPPGCFYRGRLGVLYACSLARLRMRERQGGVLPYQTTRVFQNFLLPAPW